MITTDELALLAAINAEPHNRVNVLVWCDWVEERLEETGHKQGDIDGVRRFCDPVTRRETMWLRAIGNAPVYADILYRANNNPAYRTPFYEFKSRCLRAYGLALRIQMQHILRPCYGCGECQPDQGHYRQWCDGSGHGSPKRVWLQEYRYGGRSFLVPIQAPSWSSSEIAMSNEKPDIVGRVPTAPELTLSDSERAYLTLAVATPWIRFKLSGSEVKTSLLGYLISEEETIRGRIAWLRGHD